MSGLKTFGGEIKGEVPIPGILSPYRLQVEDVTRHCENGYHPIELYETLNDRHKIVHRLGHDTHSTTWLAVDKQTGQYVAVKVGTADSTTCDEIWLRRLNRPGSSDANSVASVIPPCRDECVIKGPPFLAKKSEAPKRSNKSASTQKSARAEKPAKPKKPQDSKESKERMTTASVKERAAAKNVLDSIWINRWSRPSHQQYMDVVNEIRVGIREDWDPEDPEDWGDAELDDEMEDEMDMDGEQEDSDDTEVSEDDEDSDSDSEDEDMDEDSEKSDSSSDLEDSDDSEDL